MDEEPVYKILSPDREQDQEPDCEQDREPEWDWPEGPEQVVFEFGTNKQQGLLDVVPNPDRDLKFNTLAHQQKLGKISTPI